MGWTLDTPPHWAKRTAVATSKGWVDPVTGEVLVALGDLNTKAGAADVLKVYFGAASYARNAPLTITVEHNEKVSVTAGANIVVSWTGGNFNAYAAAQTNVNKVVYDKVVGLGSAVNVPNAAGTLSIGAQTITGTYVDTASAIAASGILTATTNFADNETVVLNGKTYTFKTTLTNTDGYVEIQSTLKKSLSALVSAVNLSAGGAGQYAAATTLHPTMSAKAVGDTIVFTAKTPGTGGNSLTTTETCANASFGGATLSGGVADVSSNKVISAGQAAAAGTRVVA